MNIVTQLKLLGAFAVFALAAMSAIAADPPFRAGAVAVDITPRKLPSIIAGGFLEGRATKITDPLHVRCIVLDDGRTKIAFAIVDTCMMTQSLIDEAKQLASAQCGIPVDHLMVSATHTHSAPAAMACLGTRQDKDYAAWLPGKIAEGIVAATKKLQPAKIGWASVDDWEHTHNRRWIRKPGNKIVDPFGNATGLANMHPGYLSADVIGPSGPVDPGLSVLSVQTLEGRPLAVLANYSQHYFGSSPVSSDYYGLFCKHIASLLGQQGEGNGPFVCAMSQGTSGDLMWMDYGSAKKTMTTDSYAEAVAKYAERALTQVRYHDSVPLAMVEKRLQLNYRVPDEKRLEWAKPIAASIENDLAKNQREVYAKEALILHQRQKTEIKLQAIQIGELTIATLPNEVYALTGLKLKAQSPFASHFNIELANGAEGYIPTPEQHVLGGYTTWPARTAGLEVQAEPKIVAMLLGALQEATGGKRRIMQDDHGPYAKAVLSAKPTAYWRLNDAAGTTAVNAVVDGVAAQISDGAAWYLPGVGSGTGIGAGETLTPSAFSGPRQINRALHLSGGDVQAEVNGLGDHYSIALWFWLGEASGASVRGGTLLAGLGGDSLSSRQFKDHRVQLVLDGSVSKTEMRAADWHLAVLVRDGNVVRVHVDGRETPEIVKAGPVQPKNNRLIFGRGLQGKLDEVAVFSRALATAEIVAFWKASGIGERRGGEETATPAVMSKIATSVNAPTGHISLDNLLSVREGKGEWVKLFNGKDLTGFHTHLRGQGKNDPEHVFSVNDGMIHVYKDTPEGKAMPFGGVITDKDYGDYHLRFEFKWGTKKFAPRTATVRDAGLLFHVFGEDGAVGGTWASSVECQIQEKDVGDLYVVGTRVSTLATKGPKDVLFAAIRFGNEVTVGDRDKIVRVVKEGDTEHAGWNTIEVIARGDAAVFIVNGKPVHYIFNIRQPDPATPTAWKPLTKGRLWFQSEGAEVSYRNIELRALPPLKVAASSSSPRTQTAVPPLSPEDSLRKVHVPAGFKAELVAAEPLLFDPVAFDWDERGRLWVVEMADYPLGMDNNGKPGGRVRRLEDTNGDGRYDKSTLFADELNFPNGIMTWRDGALVTAAPDILFLRDMDGDGRADEREVLFQGLNEGNQQLRANGLRWGLDNWVYCANGGHHVNYGKDTRVESIKTGLKFDVGSRDFRFQPDTGAMELESGPTQFGRNRDPWGHWFGTQNANPLWHYVLADRYLLRNPYVPAATSLKHIVGPGSPEVYPASAPEKRYHSFEQAGRFTSACGGMIYGDERLFGAGPALHAFTCEPFHNLVQHNVLADSGVSFTAHRARGEEKLDFFASEDRWCRPVMIRTGPDGALWVADMYRYMIEHPQWLTPEGKAELLPYYRLGDDRGRIYRIVPEKSATRTPLPLDALDTAGLVAALDSPNDWQRDKAQQMLLWKRNANAVTLLEKLARSSSRPHTRLQALCTLDGLGALQPAGLLPALADEHPRLRENALRLAETRGTPEVIAAATRLVNDPDAKVRLQLAFTLGEWKVPSASTALAELAVRNADDPFIVTAVMSSALPHAKTLLRAILQSKQTVVETYSEPLLRVSLGSGHTEATAALLAASLSPKHGDPIRNFSRLLVTLERAGSSWQKLQLRGDDKFLALVIQDARRLFSQTMTTASDTDRSADDRIAAATLLCRSPEHRAAGIAALAGWLRPNFEAEAQSQAIAALAQSGDSDVPALLAKAWPELSPALREKTLDAWMSRNAWTNDLVKRLESREISNSSFDPTRRDRLLRHPLKPIARRAVRIFKTSGSPSRAKVVEQYRIALTLPADPAKGKQVHARVCAACHKRGDEGKDIGPNLLTVTAHSPEKLLTNILDPNAEILPGFQVYNVVLDSGTVLSGLLAAETANSLSIKLADGTIRTVARREVEMLHNSNSSLMPEELERVLQPQELADLISFLRQPTRNESP